MTVLLHWLALWPLRLLHRLGACLGWVTYALSPSYRRRLQDNAGRAALTAVQRRAAVGQAGRMVAELPWLWLPPRGRQIDDWVQWRGDTLM